VRPSWEDFYANLLRQLLPNRNLGALIVNHQGSAKWGVAQYPNAVAGLDADLIK
jgi:hypothetical protein